MTEKLPNELKETSELVSLGTLNLHEAKDLKTKLANQGVELVLNHNEQTCTRGCSVTVEILLKEEDIPAISKIFQEQNEKIYGGLNINLDQINQVYDPNQAEAICPACGAKFSTSLNECPECGLCF